MRVIISEQGNGFPGVGDYCAGEGYLYRVVSIDSRIQTGRSGQANWVRATVADADWADCDENDEHSAVVSVEPDEDNA